ncbi:MAG: bifunctional diguanylate cyclase/phosphodiesterase [Clostridia bacterium]
MESKDKLNIVLETLFDKKSDVQECVLNSHNKICQLYNIDRVCSYTRSSAGLDFNAVQISKKGKEPEKQRFNHIKLHDDTYDLKKTEAIDKLQENHFIHTRKFSRYENMLREIGYEKEEELQEICVGSVFNREGFMIEYVTFEKYEGSEELTPQEIFEINILCESICDRIENFEIRKKLHDEQKINVVDALTGLPSYNVFMLSIEEYMHEKGNYAVICFDIDKFKYVNEIWGYNVGDEILSQTSTIIKQNAEDKYYCCRITGDKFVVVCKYEEITEIEQKIAKMNKEFSKMQAEKFPEIKITVISGVYVTSENVDMTVCIDRANIAKNSAKGAFDNTCTWYNNNLKKTSERESQIENRAAYALENNEFIPFLQPKFDMETGEVCGAEALARWTTAENVIAPSEFIPVFERNGFITKMDFAIYKTVFEFMHSCKEKGYKMFQVSMNVSKAHLKNPNFCEEFIELTKKYQIPHELIELEIKESAFMEDKDILKEFILKLRKSGLSISIDDFGTAYSSLNLLKDIEVDAIKLDKSLIDNIIETEEKAKSLKDEIIVKNIANMIHELNFKTVFEGIENDKQVKALKELGCYCGQGYVFSMPLDIVEFEEKYLKKA